MQTAPRVLLAGFSERNKYFGHFFYASVHKLRNGFIRAGSHAVWFSDRDIADYSAPFRIRPIGTVAANAKLLQLVDRIEPDVLCLMHTDLISDKTLAKLRSAYPQLKIFSVFIDPITSASNSARFERLAKLSDVSFATTAGETLADFARAGTVGFVPNPVDPSMENVCSYAEKEHTYDVFFAGKVKNRRDALEELRERLPTRRFGFFFQTSGGMALAGASYVKTLAQSRVAINATVPNCPLWYSSDRIAQYLTAGCLVAQPAAARLEQLYGEDGLLVYRDVDELIERAEPLLNDGSWRQLAERGRERAIEISDSALVARYMLDRCFGQQSFAWPDWSREFYPKK